jgi:hypothetical protein
MPLFFILWIGLFILISIVLIFSDEIGAVFGLFFVMLISGWIIFSIGKNSYAIDNNLNREVYKDLQIVSLVNKQGYSISGFFILGTGGVSGNSYDYYITYGKFRSGKKRLKLYAYSYYIDEGDDISPCIKNYWKGTQYDAFESKWWGKREARFEGWYENYEAKKIIVPKNTIFKEFGIKD